MLDLSNEVFSALWKYLSADWNIEKFRDYMVGLRFDKYNLLASVDRLFLDEFEGRYAEYCDLPPHDEQILKAALASYVQSDEASAAPTSVVSWAFPHVEQSTGSNSAVKQEPTGSKSVMAYSFS
jgi:hypothetical protein